MDANARSNIFGQSLRNAALKSHLDIVRLLLNKGADVEGGSYSQTEGDLQAVERRYDKESLEQQFPGISQLADTTVKAAAQKGHKEILQLLLRPEFRISRSTYSYRRAIIFAAEGGDAEILEILTASADYSSMSERSLQKLWNRALRRASFYGKTETIPPLRSIENNEYYDLTVCTPLRLAAFNGHSQTILLLQQNGANINGGPDQPLYMAILNGFAQTVKLLLD